MTIWQRYIWFWIWCGLWAAWLLTCMIILAGKLRRKNPFLKYAHPPWCTAPFEASPCGYCWGWANKIDRTPGFENPCPGCEYNGGAPQ